MITYNHERFVAQAIESVLMQETDFAYELVIGEDCSTDHTRDIVSGYASRYPDRIRLLLPERNLGAHKNTEQTLRACQGEYIAWLEGDDYWTDPHKLQKQVDFLESHPDYVVCFHNTMIEYEDGRERHLRHVKAWDTCLPEELILNFNDFAENVTAGHSSSTVYRNGLVDGLLKQYPSWLSRSMSGDIPLQILVAQYGKAKFIDQVMSVHRVHPGGISSAPAHRGITLFENRILMYEGLRGTLEGKSRKAVDQVLARCYAYVGDYYFDQLKLRKAFLLYRRAFGGATALNRIVGSLLKLPPLSPLLPLARGARRILHRAQQFWHDVQ